MATKQRMVCLQHATRRRGQLGDDGGLTIMASHYRINDQGRVFVLPEHAALALQGSKWTEVSEAELEAGDQGSPADVENRLRKEIEELRAENAVLRAQLANIPSAEATPPPLPAPTPTVGAVSEKPAAEPAASDKDTDDLSSKTRDELAQMAKDLKIDVPTSASKVKLLSELRSAMGS